MGGICHKTVVRCQGTLSPLKVRQGVTCKMLTLDAGSWSRPLSGTSAGTINQSTYSDLSTQPGLLYSLTSRGSGGQTSSMVRGQGNKVGAKLHYVIIHGIGSITPTAFYWLLASHRRPAQNQRKGRQTLPLHGSRVKESTGMF